VSRAARHRKPAGYGTPRRRLSPRHRKPSPIATALQQKPTKIAAAAAASTLIVSAGPATASWLGTGAAPVSISRSHTASSLAASDLLAGQDASAAFVRPHPSVPAQPARTPSAQPTPTRPAAPQAAPAFAYENPLRAVSGLIAERIDQGADFGGAGPVYALGDAVITNAQGDNGGWPGGGWITYQLSDGPDAGKMVFLAEDVTPQVQVGQHVTAQTVIATMYDGGDGIETGWAMPDGTTAESQLPEAGGISGNGPFPTMIGMNFEELLQKLGVPAGNNWSTSAYGTLPPGYPTSW
jgi:murein DD-endopeptidase MepM/ murein hydrolase activator NlpD